MSGIRRCTCAEHVVERYRARVSGPLLDRIDLHVAVPRLGFAELGSQRAGEPSSAVRERVIRARRLLVEADTQVDFSSLRADARGLLERAVDRLALSARAAHKIARVARTIACLDERAAVVAADIAEALQYRRESRNHVDGH